MPTVEATTRPLAESEAPLVAVGAFTAGTGERSDPPVLAADALALAEVAGIDLVAELGAAGFDASVGATLRVPTRGALPSPTVLVVGLGDRDDATLDTLRMAGAAAANAAERVTGLAVGLVDVLDGPPVTAVVQALTEGLLLGSYRFAAYRTDAPPFELAAATIHVPGAAGDEAQAAVEVGAVTAQAAALARDLVNTPPQDKRPPQLADRVVAAVAELPIEVRVLDEDALAAGGYGGILGVGQGSSEPPRLVELSYAPAGAERHVALVGKGITFDTGGISLKPSEAMEKMKTDMGGAASVAATVIGAARLGLPVRVTGLLALAENMPSGTATRVSDVLTIKDGTTVEVINTDAEGRLVLADALVHAGELEPETIVDVATLTGAAVVALGDRISVLMADDDELADELAEAAEVAGEPLWRLPVASREYGDRLEGAIADVKNAGGRAAGTIFAGLFLHRFVPDEVAWAHLDIAGTAWTDDGRGYLSAGATGVPVRTLLGWLRDR